MNSSVVRLTLSAVFFEPRRSKFAFFSSLFHTLSLSLSLTLYFTLHPLDPRHTTPVGGALPYPKYYNVYNIIILYARASPPVPREKARRMPNTASQDRGAHKFAYPFYY